MDIDLPDSAGTSASADDPNAEATRCKVAIKRAHIEVRRYRQISFAIRGLNDKLYPCITATSRTVHSDPCADCKPHSNREARISPDYDAKDVESEMCVLLRGLLRGDARDPATALEHKAGIQLTHNLVTPLDPDQLLPAFMRRDWKSPLLGKPIENLDALLEDVEYIRRRECSETAKVTVIDFWALSCKSCMFVFRHLSNLQKQYGDKINVVAVCNDAYFDESGTKTPGSAEKINLHLTDDLACSFALDAKNTLRNTLFQPAGHRALPTTMVLNANNKVEYVGSPNDGTEFDDTIKRLLD
ncbi:hypothetical protein RI367_007663 [Sorochytrium milnesiophthora]